MKTLVNLKLDGNLVKALIFTFPLIFLLCIYMIFITKEWLYWKLVWDDGIIENMTVIFYFISSLLAGYIAVFSFRNKEALFGILYIFLTCSFLFICGEEISWGQRIFNILPSEFIVKHNNQNETNVHNLKIFSYYFDYAYILIGFYGSFLWLVFYFIQASATMKINMYLVPKWYLMSYFLPVMLWFFYWYYIRPSNDFLNFKTNPQAQEPAELLLSMGFFLFVARNRFRQARKFSLYCFFDGTNLCLKHEFIERQK